MVIRPRKFYALVGVSFVCCVQSAAALKLTFDNRLSVNETISDNVDFVESHNSRSGFATRVDPTFRLGASGSRAGLQLSYRIFHTQLHAPVSRSETTSQAIVNFRGAVIPHKLYLRSDLNYGDRALRSLRLSEPEGLANSNKSKFGTYHITPTWYELFAGQYAQRVTYRWESSLGDDEFGPRNSRHNLTWRFSNDPQDSRLQWRLRARHAYDGRTVALERRELVAGAGWYVNDDFAWLGRVGRDDVDDPAIATAESGRYWSVGFSWKLRRGIELGALAGDDDKQLQLSLNVSPRTQLVLGALDRESGLNGGARRYFGGLSHHGRFTSIRSTYAENYIDGSGLSLTLLDPNNLGGNDFDNANLVAFDNGDGGLSFAELGVITGRVLERDWTSQLSYQRRRNSLSLSYQVSRLTPLQGQAAQRSNLLAVTGSRKHSSRWQSQAFSQWLRSETDGTPSSELTFIGYSLNYLLNSKVRLGLQLDRRDLHRTAESDLSETRLLGFAQVSFGRGAAVSLTNDDGSSGGFVDSARYEPNHSDISGFNARRDSVDVLLDDFSDFSQLQAERIRNGGGESRLFELDDELQDEGGSGFDFGDTGN